MDCSLPGSSVRGILQARILEWVAISFSRGSPALARGSLPLNHQGNPHCLLGKNQNRASLAFVCPPMKCDLRWRLRHVAGT